MPSGEYLHPRRYLFLQSHPSTFGKVVAERMRAAGADCRLINLSFGDRLFRAGTGAVDYTGRLADWPAFLERFLGSERITDIVYYADQRPYHRVARRLARPMGIRCFAYEFGYLRPDWITLEREGMGAWSHFPDDPDLVEQLARDHAAPGERGRYPYGFAAEAVNEVTYHLTPVFLPFFYPHYERDRFYHPLLEYPSYIPKLLRRRGARRAAERVIDRLARGDAPYFVVIMQMQGDYQVRRSGPYRRLHEMIAAVTRSFAAAAPSGHRLVFKMHPLENGMENWPGVIRAQAAAQACEERVDVIDGGDLQRLFRNCSGVVTLNSTAGLTAVTQGVPVKTLGVAVYDMPRVTYQGPLDRFWREAEPPTRATVDALVKLLAATIQVKGNFFTRPGREVAAAEFTRRLLSDDVANGGAFVDPPPRLAKARCLGVPGLDDEFDVG